MPKQYSPLSQLRYDILEVAKKIQQQLGTTHSEANYHKLMTPNLRATGLQVEHKPKLIVKDDFGRKAFGYEPDQRVRRKELSILVELKADSGGISPSHVRQAKAYLSVSPKDSAVLIINFARKDKEKNFLPEFRMIYRDEL